MVSEMKTILKIYTILYMYKAQGQRKIPPGEGAGEGRL